MIANEGSGFEENSLLQFNSVELMYHMPMLTVDRISNGSSSNNNRFHKIYGNEGAKKFNFYVQFATLLLCISILNINCHHDELQIDLHDARQWQLYT